MADSALRCAVCERNLTPQDKFCSGCGTPTPTGADDDAGRPSLAELDPIAAAYDVRLREALKDEFEFIDVIGQGGFARVHRARDLRLDRLVAIKVIRPDLAGAHAFLDRFRREGVALAQLRHPGVVPIYDIRENDGIIYYIIMNKRCRV